MVSVARCLQVVRIPSEKELVNKNDEDFLKGKYRHEIPDLGQRSERGLFTIPENSFELKLENFSMKYRNDLTETLKNINLETFKGQKIGIIGRTGAGKSSLIHALLRFSEPMPGSSYYINGYNALNLGLHTLRKQFTVVPQSPFLINGPIRENLDTQNKFTNEKLWEVLQKVHLR